MNPPAVPPSPSPKRGRPSGGKKGPGRPEGQGNQREQILDAAEHVFADHGFVAATLREVAEKASVTQALINYYFESKLGLFEQVFLRRSKHVSEQRVARMAELRGRGKRFTPRQVVESFLLPALQLRETPGGRAFIRLQARLHLEPPDISYRLRDVAYTGSTRMYVQALMEAIPQLSEKDAYWRMTSLIGTYIYMFSDTHRLEEYAPGMCNPEDPVELLDQVTRFVIGGLKAP